MNNKKLKIALLVSHPIQYHTILWQNISKIENVKAKVFFYSDFAVNESLDKDFNLKFKWDRDLLEGYEYQFYKNFSPFKNGFFKYFNTGILFELLKNKYDIVYIHGVNYFTSVAAIIIARIFNKKVLLRGISHNLNLNNNYKKKFKSFFYKILFRFPSNFLYIGKHNYNYYKDYNVPDSKLIFAPHVVDNEYFQKQKTQNKEKLTEIKTKHGIKVSEKVLLFSGKLYDKKQPFLLLEAFGKADIKDWCLLIIGDGILKNELIAYSKNIDKKIIFAGFKNQSEISEPYNIGDIVVLPSKSETWGLVINEAYNFECAAIVSNMVGCEPDLVENKNTGLCFSYNSVDDLKINIEKLCNNETLLREYKKNSLELINNWSIKEFIHGFKIAIQN